MLSYKLKVYIEPHAAMFQQAVAKRFSPPLLPWCAHRSLLSPKDLAAAACTHAAWRAAVNQEEGIWRQLCETEFALAARVGPDRAPLPTYKSAFDAWQASFGKYGTLAGRALRAWKLVEDWTKENFPPVAGSLR
jgi:hypothetical protein